VSAVHEFVTSEMANRGWKPANLVAACAGSPSRATVYYFLAGDPISRRCQAQILRALGTTVASSPAPAPPDGAEIRRRREDLGLTQPKLAARAGLHPDYLRKLERGQCAPIPQSALVRLLRALEAQPARSRQGIARQ
jgi:DNA-binding transcriptional regulator YiaG